MKTNIKTLVIDKTDIIKQSENKKLPELKLNDLRRKSFDSFTASDFVIGISESGQTVVLKNRWGHNGIVVSQEDYNKFVKPNYENSKSDNPSKKKSLLARIFGNHAWPFN